MHTIIRRTWESTSWLLQIMLPISLCVSLMQRLGIIDIIAHFLDPIFCHAGLPGASAIVFVTGAFGGTYPAVAAMLSIDFTMREASIIGIMVCLCHALVMEGAVVQRTGSSFCRITLLRILAAFAAAFYLNWLLPDMEGMLPFHQETDTLPWDAWCLATLLSLVKLALGVAAIIFALMVLQYLLECYHVIPFISKLLSPFMKLFGLSPSTAYPWIVGNVLGLSYGSALVLEAERSGTITRTEMNTLNYHLAMNHSLVEDTLVFAALGVAPFWVVSTRVLFALVVVWGRRAVKCVGRN